MTRCTFHRLPDSAFEPLRITAWLQCGIVADATLPIDGVLYYTAMREQYGPQSATFPGSETPHPGAVPGSSLPLKRCDGHGPQWYYAASFAEWPEAVAEGQDYWNCRLDTSLARYIDFRGRRGNLDIAAGRYKSYHMPVFYRHAEWVRWYVLGHQESIEQLLRFVTHLGKKSAQGWGAVLRWEVEPWPQDWSVRRDGKLMRAIPSSELDGILTGFRPSYWLPKNQALCEVPTSTTGDSRQEAGACTPTAIP